MAKVGRDPERIDELVTYQEQSIVSRKLISRSGGNVTAFAFAEGEELSEHTTPYDALVQVVEGEAVIEVGGVVHEVRAGELLALPANVPHALRAEQPFKMLLTMLKGA